MPNKSRTFTAFLFLLLTLSAALSSYFLAYFHSQKQENVQLRYEPYSWHSDWIRPAEAGSSSACFRKEVYIPDIPTNAYLAVAADNFYQLTVNGETLTAFNHPAMANTLPKGATLYNELGYPRYGAVGNVYNIKKWLVPGRNIICIYVRSDQGTPRMGVEGAIDAGDRQVIRGDGSWKAITHAMSRHDIAWNQVDCSDLDWPNAVDTQQRVTVPLDGDVSALNTPLFGSVIVPADAMPGFSSVKYHKSLHFNEASEEGWLRVNCPYRYDVYINDELVGGTYTIRRFSRPFFAMQGFIDSFDRIEYTPLSYQYPQANPRDTVDVYTYRSLFVKGDNTIDIVAHPHQFEVLDATPASICVDVQTTEKDGSQTRFASDGTWTIQRAGSGWERAVIIGARDGQMGIHWRSVLRGKVFPIERIVRDQQQAFGFALAAILFLIVLAAGTLRLLYPFPVQQLGMILLLLVLPGLVPLVTCAVIQAVFSSSPQDIFFSTPRFSQLVLEAAAAAWLLMGAGIVIHVLSRRRLAVTWVDGPVGEQTVVKRETPQKRLLAFFGRLLDHYGYAIVLSIIVAAAALLYLHNLNRSGFIPDEYVSMLAARGILRHGIPIYEQTGIIYARSALFHYTLAPFMAMAIHTGDLGWTRMPSILYQILTVLLIYQFAKTLKGRPAGLTAALFTAFSPFMIYYARETRFYSQFAFYDTLTCYLLWMSLKQPERKWLRYGTIFAYIAAYESQQIAMTIVPAALIAIMFSGQLKLWLEKRVLALMALALAVMCTDIYLFLEFCQTPLPFVDIDSVMLLALHSDRLEMIPSMLLMSNEREQILLFFLFLCNLTYALVRTVTQVGSPKKGEGTGWHWWSYLNLLLIMQCALIGLIIPRPVSRYAVHLVPLLSLVGACTLAAIAEHGKRWLLQAQIAPARGRLVVNALAILLVAAGFASYRPLRVWNTTDREVNRNLTSSARYVYKHQRPGDKVIFFSPEVAMVEIGHCDYMWRPSHGSIFKYVGKDGVLRERNSGAVVVDNVDKLRQLTLSSQRVWIVLHPGAIGDNVATNNDFSNESLIMAEFVGDNYQNVYEAFGTEVLLWDRASNHYVDPAPYRGYDQFRFQ